MKNIVHINGEEPAIGEPLQWQVLTERLETGMNTGMHRKTFLESLIRFGREQECCGRKNSAEKIYRQVQDKLNRSSRPGGGMRPAGVFDFSKVTGFLLDQARRNTAEVFNRHLDSFPELERKYFNSRLGKYNETGILERNVSEDLSDFRRLREEISDRVARYGAKGRQGLGSKRDTASDTAGRYNARYNLQMLAHRIGQSDPLWLKDLLAHYAALSRFSSLFS